MADTAHKTDEEVKEHFDTPDVLEKKLDKLAELVQQSKNLVIFTGAGISTSAGIPDFRGPQGVWTLRAKGISVPRGRNKGIFPTKAHMALVELQNRGVMKYLISQNCDGLHRISGIDENKISELHGNTNVEYCGKCGKKYLRRYKCRNSDKVHDHRTGRKCSCGGELLDSIINFGENLPEEPLTLAEKYSKKADLCIVFGSSLRVTPAADLPEMTVDKGGKLVICNLQKTPLDPLAMMLVHAKCDDIMEKLMARLGLTIPHYVYRRDVQITTAIAKESGGYTVSTKFEATDGASCKFVNQIALSIGVGASGPVTLDLAPPAAPKQNGTRNGTKPSKEVSLAGQPILEGRKKVSAMPQTFELRLRCHTGHPDHEADPALLATHTDVALPLDCPKECPVRVEAKSRWELAYNTVTNSWTAKKFE